ncbi:hypothetical protein D5R93_08005 [Actinomyces lilanjuaniae]|uniref:Uncharacterized protein n=2 Tax=Actinomyces lilanjuaniae TaxID=2321394 RepID=A0ABN5PNQ9_9ACTO|nr:hypothetical protein D5R93_08005 [Actinomyces lilanjuaniae]
MTGGSVHGADYLAASGWVKQPSMAHLLLDNGVPLPTREFLHDAFEPAAWAEADKVCRHLEQQFRDCNFSQSVVWGPLLVPRPDLLDVRGALGAGARESQEEITRPDFVDERLPEGADVTDPASPWTLYVTAVSDAGLAMGSYDEVRGRGDDLGSSRDEVGRGNNSYESLQGGAGGRFLVDGFDTRALMVRQLWGALVVQNLRAPDSEKRDRWTMTLFAGEEPVEGMAVSGTVLHGQVRQRLGKTSRGSAPVRVRPALRVASAVA